MGRTSSELRPITTLQTPSPPPLFRHQSSEKAPGCSEVAGGLAAGCAAVCCCCPCGILSFLVLAMVKLPAGLCRKALRRRRMRKKKKKGEVSVTKSEEMEEWMMVWPDKSPSEEVLKMDEEMWEVFHSTGFWRSSSARYL